MMADVLMMKRRPSDPTLHHQADHWRRGRGGLGPADKHLLSAAGEGQALQEHSSCLCQNCWNIDNILNPQSLKDANTWRFRVHAARTRAIPGTPDQKFSENNFTMEETTTIHHLFQQLSIALAKGNAALFNNHNTSGVTQSDEGLGW